MQHSKIRYFIMVFIFLSKLVKSTGHTPIRVKSDSRIGYSFRKEKGMRRENHFFMPFNVYTLF